MSDSLPSPLAASEEPNSLQKNLLPGWARSAHDPVGVSLAFTSTAEGNLGLHVGKHRNQTQGNRRVVEERMAVAPGSVFFLEQVHGTDIAVAEEYPLIPPALSPEEEREAAPLADAALTTTGRPLAVMTADCLPVILTTHDPLLYAVAHAGRRGLLDGILPKTVARLREYGAREVTAWIGPNICGSCYEVPDVMRTESERLIPGIGTTTSWGTPALDLAAAAHRQLEDHGIVVHRELADCTFENAELYSHRRAPGEGRLCGVVWADVSEYFLAAERSVSQRSVTDSASEGKR